MQHKNTTRETLTVGFGVCVVCSMLVSTAAVFLKPKQESNQKLDIQKNILIAAGLLESGQGADAKKIGALFGQVETKVVDLGTGLLTDEIDVATFDSEAAASDPKTSIALASGRDFASIRRRANYRLVYMIREGEQLKRLILPVYGKGLWSTMYGFLALDADLNTITSLAFYQHGETPGLGGEVDNPLWKAHWPGKKVYEADGWDAPKIRVIKGAVDPAAADAAYEVDGLSGATLTSRGVSNMLLFWMGQDGYGPFLAKMREGEHNG